MDLTEAELKKFRKKKTLLEKLAALENSLRTTDYESSDDELERRDRKYRKLTPDLFRHFRAQETVKRGVGSEILTELNEVSSRRERDDAASSSNESLRSEREEGSVDKMRIRDPKGKQRMEKKWKDIISSVFSSKYVQCLLEQCESESEDESGSSSEESESDEDWDASVVDVDVDYKWHFEPAYGPKIERRDKTVVYWTHSRYEGEWDADLDVPNGKGMYKMPHGVVYVGEIHDGTFHGKGVLRYPNGAMIEGVWNHGRILKRRITFHDGLRYKEKGWKYCLAPDRRFHIERLYGLRPAGRSHLTQDYPTRKIAEGCYDTGDGHYNHKTRCVYSNDTGKVLRIPTNKEAKWIMENCRKAWDENVNYEPDLFENIDDSDEVETLMSPREGESKETNLSELELLEDTIDDAKILDLLFDSASDVKKENRKERKKAREYEVPFSMFSEPYREGDADDYSDMGDYLINLINSFLSYKIRLAEKEEEGKLEGKSTENDLSAHGSATELEQLVDITNMEDANNLFVLDESTIESDLTEKVIEDAEHFNVLDENGTEPKKTEKVIEGTDNLDVMDGSASDPKKKEVIIEDTS